MKKGEETYHLWSAVEAGARDANFFGFLVAPLKARAEISNFDTEHIVNEDVLGFDVQVRDGLRVHGLKGEADLFEDESNLSYFKGATFDKVQKILDHPLQHNDTKTPCTEAVKHVDNLGDVVAFGKSVDLTFELGLEPAICQRDELHHHVVFLFVDRAEDTS